MSFPWVYTWVARELPRVTGGLPVDCTWAVHELPVPRSWVIHRLCMGYPRVVHWLLMDCP